MTELTWEGKYKDGKKVTPVRIDLPFQTIETINESNAERERQQGFSFDQRTEWRNRLIWGDKKYVLPSLLPEFAGKVNLIYIDPPFNVGSDFSFTAKIADDPDTDEDESAEFVKQPSIIEQKAYRDTWGRGLDSYLQWFFETATLLRDLLCESGSIYVHLDSRMVHYCKTVMDEVFGYDNFVNEIAWCYEIGGRVSKQAYGRRHDTILFYSKTGNHTFNFEDVMDEWSEKGRAKFKYEDEKGRYRLIGRFLKDSPIKGHRDISPEWEKTHPELVQRYYMKAGKAQVDYWNISPINQVSPERVGYETQKPEALLERIIKASSNETDLILDCFCGSGTTAAVAEKLNRQWITCDLGRFSIHTTRKRLLGVENVKPFVVQNLGKYERQQWMAAEFESQENRLNQERDYRHFIVDLYHAKPLDGYTWVHGARAGRMVHVGSVEAPVTVEDIKATIKEFWKMAGGENAAETNGIDFLGWDFAFDVNETAAHFANANNVKASFKKIPREVLEKKAVEQGDIKFYELASLGVKVKTAKKQIEVTLSDFIIPPDDVPEEVRGKITHWSQWIDYWAIDWNYRDDTFHNEWQSYRTKKEPKIDLTAINTDVMPGKYTVLVKVIDILGNDTTKAVEVEV